MFGNCHFLTGGISEGIQSLSFLIAESLSIKFGNYHFLEVTFFNKHNPIQTRYDSNVT